MQENLLITTKNSKLFVQLLVQKKEKGEEENTVTV